LRQVNKRVLECLIKAGALDCFGGRAQLLEIMDRMIAYSHQRHEAKDIGQWSFFDLDDNGLQGASGESLFYPLPRLNPIPAKKMLQWEKELLGTYVSEHPLQALAHLPAEVISSDQIDATMKGQEVTLVGMVAGVRVITTRTDKPMAFVQLEDLHSTIEVVVFPNLYADTAELWAEDNILLVQGRVDERDGSPKILCQSVEEYTPSKTGPRELIDRPRLLQITFHRTDDLEQDKRRLNEICRLLESYRGNDRYRLRIVSPVGIVQMDFPNYTTKCNPELQRKLGNLLGRDALQVDWA